MEINIFGKADCVKCETAKKRLKSLLSRKKLTKEIPLNYFDMESVDGMAEGAFYDVLEVPTIIINDKNEKLGRWDGNVPPTSEITKLLNL